MPIVLASNTPKTLSDSESSRKRIGSLLVPLMTLLALGLSTDANSAPDPRPVTVHPRLSPTNLPGGPLGVPPGIDKDGGNNEGGDQSSTDDGSSASKDGGAGAKPRPPRGGSRSGGGDVEMPGKARAGTADPIDPTTQFELDFVNAPIRDIVELMADITEKNFILTEELKGEITIISHKPVNRDAAYQAILSALEQAGFTIVEVNGIHKVVQTGKAANQPLTLYKSDQTPPRGDQFVTQLIQLENVTVGDVSSVAQGLAGSSAKVVAYAPSNTLIITDAAANIRRVIQIVSELDTAAPKAEMEIIPLHHATAAELQKIIEQLYGTESASTDSSSSRSSSSRRSSRRRSSSKSAGKADAGGSASATKVGSEGKYIQKVLSDERTNSIIIMANQDAMKAVKDLIARLDVDVDPASRAQIHVIYLQHAKAEDVSQVLSNLSQGSNTSSSSSSRSRRNSTNSRSSRRGGAEAGGRNGPGGPFGANTGESTTSAVAAFDSGVRITSDENTNSLVIIATPDQLRYIQQVVSQLDVRRKQVFVECVIMEIASEDSDEFGIGFHGGNASEDGMIGIGSAQLNGSSLGLSADLLSGMAVGVFGPSIEVPLSGLDSTTSTSISVPAFGVALNALQSNSSVTILSNPNILTMDNEEAKIVVGRNIPFPVSNSRDNNNNPIVSYQREDVAITLKVTPQINESEFVTLEVYQEAQEIEEDSQGLDVSSAGFITSKRSVENTVVVKDDQTIVIGGLIGETDTQVESKVPILGDIPLLGRLFRGQRTSTRRTNLLIFLTPHIIDEPADLEEVYRIKWAQRQEFIRRFYGKSRDQQEAEMMKLLSYSMNVVDEPSPYRSSTTDTHGFHVQGEQTTGAGPVSTPTGDSPATQPVESTDTNVESNSPGADSSVEAEEQE